MKEGRKEGMGSVSTESNTMTITVAINLLSLILQTSVDPVGIPPLKDYQYF